MTGLQPIIQFAAARVLNSLPEGLLIALLAWLMLRLSGKQNSGTRFAVWFVALIAVAASPFIPSFYRSAAAQAVRPEITLPDSWATVIFAFWIAIAVLALARAALGLYKLRSLRRSSAPIDASEFNLAVRPTVEQFGNGRKVDIRSSNEVRVPTVIGFFRPVILLPQWALRELSSDELKVILLHEYAHVQRWDDWTNLAQKLARSLFFFHPAVWWIERRLSLEREMACDDLVLAHTANPRAYAECLVSLAEKSFVRRGLAMTQALLSHARETTLRLAQILDRGRHPGAFSFRPVLRAVVVLAGVGLLVFPYSSRLIAFEEPTPAPVVHFAAKLAPELEPAKLVPATLPLKNPEKALPVSRKTAAKPDSERTAAIHTASAKQKPLTPGAVLARANIRQTAVSPQVQLVMQTTTQFDEYGNPVWSVSVWQLTFSSPRAVAAESAIANSI